MKRQRKIHLFETNPEYLVIYNELMKQHRFWNSSGQYFMARECGSKAKQLLSENLEGFNQSVKPEGLYCPTKKISY